MTPPPRQRKGGLVRPYVVTEGRAHPTRNTLDLVTLLVAYKDQSMAGLSPEKRRLIELCRPGALSVAEVSGHLSLPVSVVKVLVADLMDSGHLGTRSPIPSAQPTDARILQEVLDGLRARL